MRKRECVLLAAVAFTAILLGLAARTALLPDGPVANGHPLRFWLRQLDASTPSGASLAQIDQVGSHSSPERIQAATAIRDLGIDALPYLLHALTNTDSTFRTRVRAFLQGKLHCDFVHSASELWRGAVLGFAVLGPVAKPALPALDGALNLKSQDEGVRQHVAFVLAFIGAAGQASLVRGVAGTDRSIQQDSALALKVCRVTSPAVLQGLMQAAVRNPGDAPFFISLTCDLGRESGLVIPFLTNELRSPLLTVRMAAITGLDELAGQGIHSQMAIAALLDSLQSTNLAQQAAAAVALGSFGSRARTAEPALLAFLRHLNTLDSNAVTQAALALPAPLTQARLRFLQRYGLLGPRTYAKTAVTAVWNSLDKIDPDWTNAFAAVDSGGTKALLPPWPRDPMPRFLRSTYEEYLAIGKGLKSPPAGPSLEEWLGRVGHGIREPRYGAEELSDWLRKAAPAASPQQTIKELDAIRNRTRQAVRAIGTNAIPWLLTWLQSPNAEEELLSRRGFALLRNDGLCAVRALGQLAQSNDPEVRNRAYGSLMSIDPNWRILLAALLPALRFPDLNIRMQATEFLSRSRPGGRNETAAGASRTW